MNEQQMQFSYDRRRTSTLTLDEQPGAHTGATRKYIPGYSDSNIVFLNTSTGNDANTGASIAQALLTYAAAVTAAGSTKKIRLVNSATLTSNITKPTEATIGTTSTIASASMTAPVNVWTQAGTPSFGADGINAIAWSSKNKRFVAVGESGKIGYSTDGNVYTQAATPSFGSTDIFGVAWSDELSIFVSCGASGKVAYSANGDVWTQVTAGFTSAPLYAVTWNYSLSQFVIVGGNGQIGVSSDGLIWSMASDPSYGNDDIRCVVWCNFLSLYVSGSDTGKIAHSPDGIVWTQVASPGFSGDAVYSICVAETLEVIIASGDAGKIGYSGNAITWAQSGTPSFGADAIYGILWVEEIGQFVACGTSGKVAYSSDGDTFTQSGTPSYGGTDINCVAYSPLIGKAALGGVSGKLAYSTAFATTISATVAGFSIQAVQYSGTVTAYNCTLKQPGTTAALSLDACRVTESGSHISNNAVTSRATLYEGDRHLTCTPAAQNAIDMNLDTWGGTFYIYNASQTGYERIRDCLGNGPIVANYPVTVGGRANVEGTSVNVLFDAEVTHNDPRFVDETDYKLEFQTNGYTRNSFAAARSNIYFNSAGDARDIGAWSYVESAVSYYYAKTEVMYKGEISHGLEFALNEQQGDSGVVSVYGNTRRVKEVITITYGTTYDREKAIFEYMLTLQDKGVKIQLDAEWNDNAGTVVVNGNQAAGVEFLTVDSTTYYEGMWLTISGEQYWVMRASPTPSAATKLILDRPLEDAVLDNDVIVRNYPAGAGEYQFSGPMNLTMKRVHPTALQGYYSGFQIRLVRKKQ